MTTTATTKKLTKAQAEALNAFAQSQLGYVGGSTRTNITVTRKDWETVTVRWATARILRDLGLIEFDFVSEVRSYRPYYGCRTYSWRDVRMQITDRGREVAAAL